jgi:hypothetical protein
MPPIPNLPIGRAVELPLKSEVLWTINAFKQPSNSDCKEMTIIIKSDTYGKRGTGIRFSDKLHRLLNSRRDRWKVFSWQILESPVSSNLIHICTRGTLVATVRGCTHLMSTLPALLRTNLVYRSHRISFNKRWESDTKAFHRLHITRKVSVS